MRSWTRSRRPCRATGVRIRWPAPGAIGLVRVAERLDVGTPPGILRAALGVTTGRSGLAVAVGADDFAGVLAVLRGQGLTDDEISFMGVVLVLGARDTGPAAGATEAAARTSPARPASSRPTTCARSCSTRAAIRGACRPPSSRPGTLPRTPGTTTRGGLPRTSRNGPGCASATWRPSATGVRLR